mmetsp:Transcript_32839/g.82461  ORF Transcript_32839/g.82461 Transcript_32839/m.82461 type:complete len:151 (-) Transcript_32839:316-768(-)
MSFEKRNKARKELYELILGGEGWSDDVDTAPDCPRLCAYDNFKILVSGAHVHANVRKAFVECSEVNPLFAFEQVYALANADMAPSFGNASWYDAWVLDALLEFLLGPALDDRPRFHKRRAFYLSRLVDANKHLEQLARPGCECWKEATER